MGKIIGGILLIIGTSVGAGMLALPTATAAGGFYHTLIYMLVAWLVMTIGAFFILEVNLWFESGSNLVSMAKETLGVVGQVVTWAAYLLLLYCLLSAYTAGGSDLLRTLLSLVSITIPAWLSSVVFVALFGLVVSFGVRWVDWSNRGLMSVKLLAYVLLVIFVAPHVEAALLVGGNFHRLAPAVMVMITAFGYATIIPTLRSYFNSSVKPLRLCVLFGSLISLVCYLAWVLVVQGSLGSSGPHGLIYMAHHGGAAGQLMQAVSDRLHSHSIDGLAHVFASICVLTSFLGVALCMTDFLADGLRIKKQGGGKCLVMALTLLPPLGIIIFYPHVFIAGIVYAGVACVILLMLLPALMVFSGRYVLRLATGYRCLGGMPLVIAEIVLGIFLLIYALMHL